MRQKQLNLKPGTWLVADCGSMPSESNCQLIMVAPEDQRQDLVAAGTKHAIDKHKHEDSDELRKGVEGMLEVLVVT